MKYGHIVEGFCPAQATVIGVFILLSLSLPLFIITASQQRKYEWKPPQPSVSETESYVTIMNRIMFETVLQHNTR